MPLNIGPPKLQSFAGEQRLTRPLTDVLRCSSAHECPPFRFRGGQHVLFSVSPSPNVLLIGPSAPHSLGADLALAADMKVRVSPLALTPFIAASPDLLKWLLRGLGAALERAAALAAAIVDFRDEDDIRGVNGAESAAYLAAGLAHGPKNAPFETGSEVDQVLGMDLNLLGHLRAVTTVRQAPRRRTAPDRCDVGDSLTMVPRVIEDLGQRRP
jgi:Type II secretion system (T2SS), protein K